MDRFVLIAAEYDDEADALVDCAAVEARYRALNSIDTFDAAVMTMDAQGRTRIVERPGDLTLDARAGGVAVGLAVGALVALFPAVALGAGLLVGGAAGAVGVLARHAVGGLSSSDLKALADLLSKGRSGFVVVADKRMQPQLIDSITRARAVVERDLVADPSVLGRDSRPIV